MAFVLLSLASWFGVLGLLGRYLPANAVTTNKQVTINMRSNLLTSHWVKINGRWQFQRISSIRKLPYAGVRRIATTQTPNSSRKKSLIGSSADSQAPQTTASINPSKQRKIRKKALRAALANEIGRWAKIGNRWEWQPVGERTKAFEHSRETETLGGRESFLNRQRQGEWLQWDESRRFEVLEDRYVFRNI